jgi:hypothetical protein
VVNCAGIQKKRAEFSGSTAEGIISCPKEYSFSDKNEGIFFFSFVDFTVCQCDFHWEILNLDTGQRFVFLTTGGRSFPSASLRTKRYLFAVTAGRYRLSRLFLDDVMGIVQGEKEYFHPYEFEITHAKIVYLGHIEIHDPNIPITKEWSFKNYFSFAGSSFTGKNIPEELKWKISDQIKQDAKWLRKRYKSFQDRNILKNILKETSNSTKWPKEAGK